MTMLTVSVRMLENSPVGKSARFPDTQMTAMASPIALPVPRMSAEMIPERAAGTTTRKTACALVFPMASAPSKYCSGTASSAFLESEVMVGMTMIASRMEEARMPSP